MGSNCLKTLFNLFRLKVKTGFFNIVKYSYPSNFRKRFESSTDLASCTQNTRSIFDGKFDCCTRFAHRLVF